MGSCLKEIGNANNSPKTDYSLAPWSLDLNNAVNPAIGVPTSMLGVTLKKSFSFLIAYSVALRISSDSERDTHVFVVDTQATGHNFFFLSFYNKIPPYPFPVERICRTNG